MGYSRRVAGLFSFQKETTEGCGRTRENQSRGVRRFTGEDRQIQEIKSYNLEERSLNEFYHKLDSNTRTKIKAEFSAGIATSLAGMLMKLGIVTVAIVGANMLIAGQINILVYIAYLILTASIYLPIEGILTFMAMIVALDGVVARIKEIKTMPVQEGKRK